MDEEPRKPRKRGSRKVKDAARMGGHARARSMTPEQRSASARKAALARHAKASARRIGTQDSDSARRDIRHAGIGTHESKPTLSSDPFWDLPSAIGTQTGASPPHTPPLTAQTPEVTQATSPDPGGPEETDTTGRRAGDSRADQAAQRSEDPPNACQGIGGSVGGLDVPSRNGHTGKHSKPGDRGVLLPHEGGLGAPSKHRAGMDLFGEAWPSKAKAKSRARRGKAAQTEAELQEGLLTQRGIAHFCAEFEATRGVKYEVSGRDAARMRALVKRSGLEFVNARATMLLRHRDKWYADKGDVATLDRDWNRLGSVVVEETASERMTRILKEMG